MLLDYYLAPREERFNTFSATDVYGATVGGITETQAEYNLLDHRHCIYWG
jgi:hypothetical protein